MPAPDAIACDQLAKLVGTPRAPMILDIRPAASRASDPRLIASARPLPENSLSVAHIRTLSADLSGPVVVACDAGHGRSQGLAALLRHQGLRAEYLEGGHAAWVQAGLPTCNPAPITRLDASGRSVWVTRSRPKIDRIACPWLILRFVDPRAVFLYVLPSEVSSVADLVGAMPYDIGDVFWSHRGEECTFDTMIREFGLRIPALDRLAMIVRGADTDRLDLAPECAGLLAASLGLSRMHSDDLAQLEAGMGLYDAFYRWCRDATGERHNWENHAGPAR